MAMSRPGSSRPRQQTVGPSDAAFACVVVDHVHDDFEAGLVQCAHHVYDFLAHGGRAPFSWAAFSSVGGFGGEVAEGGVAPVVLAAVFLQEELVLLGHNRQQFDAGCDA